MFLTQPKEAMKKLTLSDIRAIGTCYDPVEFLPENWEGTVIDILDIEECPVQDRLWVVLREDFIDAKRLRLFAVYCAREALKLTDSPDPRSLNACNTAERYANGECSEKELREAGTAGVAARTAGVAARAVAEAAWVAAWEKAGEAARVEAREEAGEAAGEAARAAQVKQLKLILLNQSI